MSAWLLGKQALPNSGLPLSVFGKGEGGVLLGSERHEMAPKTGEDSASLIQSLRKQLRGVNCRWTYHCAD